MCTDSKICFKCGIKKPLSEFYKHPEMKDGHLNKCKECTKKDTKENRLKNHEYYCEYDMMRGNLPHRKKLRRKTTVKYRAIHPERMAIYDAVAHAIKKGVLVKPNRCQKCGSDKRIEGHHKDYSKPLEVEWLCSRCHRIEHANHSFSLV